LRRSCQYPGQPGEARHQMRILRLFNKAVMEGY
jgi:hypothetical protein